MGTTANQGLPYPEPSTAPFVHLDIKALAEAVDTKLTALPRIQEGTVAIGSVAAGATTSVSVTFPVAFANVPFVALITGSSRLTVGISTVSTTGVTFDVSNWSPANSAVSNTCRWLAIDAP